MDKKESPKVTGISEITGKIVRVRHATEADMPSIEEIMKKYQFDLGGLDYSEFLVAAEDSEIVGFGNLKKTGAIYSVGCVVVVEEKRGQGIGRLIAKHLVDDASVDRIFVAPALTEQFRKLGFVEMKDRPEKYINALDSVCGDGKKPAKVLMSRRDQR